ncbi:MAG: hypothetical protein AAGJ35_14625, partial [Myxococcota bacterium]
VDCKMGKQNEVWAVVDCKMGKQNESWVIREHKAELNSLTEVERGCVQRFERVGFRFLVSTSTEDAGASRLAFHDLNVTLSHDPARRCPSERVRLQLLTFGFNLLKCLLFGVTLLEISNIWECKDERFCVL